MEQEYERTEGAPQEEEARQETPEETAPEGTAPEESAPEGSTAEAVWSRLSEELTGLYQDGWPIEQLQAFAQDEQARAQIASGATARQAATAYLLRSLAERKDGKEVMQEESGSEAQEKESDKSAAENAQQEGRKRKRGVPALRAATTGGMPAGNAIERLSSSEFAKFSDDVYARLMAGEKIAL